MTDIDKELERLDKELERLADPKTWESLLEKKTEVVDDDCAGVHAMTSNDGKHWTCALCGYKDVTP